MQLFDYTSRLLAYPHGGVIEQKTVDVAGISRPVCYVHDDDWLSAGQAFVFTHILINRAQLEDKSELAHDYIFLHEAGHKRWPWIGQLFFTLGQLTYVALLLILLAAFPPFLFKAVQQPTIQQTALYILSLPLIYGLVISIPLTITWVDEGAAEIFALSQLGRERYLDVLEEKSKTDSGIAAKIHKRVMYPADRLVVAFARWRGIG